MPRRSLDRAWVVHCNTTNKIGVKTKIPNSDVNPANMDTVRFQDKLHKVTASARGLITDSSYYGGSLPLHEKDDTIRVDGRAKRQPIQLTQNGCVLSIDFPRKDQWTTMNPRTPRKWTKANLAVARRTFNVLSSIFMPLSVAQAISTTDGSCERQTEQDKQFSLPGRRPTHA